MRMRSLLTLVIGIGVAGFSVYASRELLQVQTATASIDANEPKLVSVVVAAQDIPFGKTIEAHKLTTIQWPTDAVPPGTYSDFSTLVPEAGQEPRRAKRAIAQGELVLANKLSEFGEKVTITQTLGKNSRAMAIRVNASTAVGGFVTPGDTVDIVLTQGGGESLRAVTILQNIRIIGVDQQADENNETANVAKTVTVEVTPEQGQKLALAEKAGQLSLSLRTLDSVVDEPMESIRLSDIIREKSPTEEGPKMTIKVRRAGVNIENVEVEERTN
ncbi:Flp pilus assembly protein CpaB [Silicimonas algicola]|uniref:Pilus assembly protein CpaB n=1 Tax=Silicimonas algicola TaxID=1826607 RepID=A0A316G7C8_9RHOB|nr:Flp pilus assembly protein CpaB [Silicimonas algicola]AZQ67193.1 Flp pilus assembly protein CpaB [Silicimonas algicola]PWK56851.1 pilus assembly protein CpaB [Silicimonas algicola]